MSLIGLFVALVSLVLILMLASAGTTLLLLASQLLSHGVDCCFGWSQPMRRNW